jgi:hypothetical protein
VTLINPESAADASSGHTTVLQHIVGVGVMLAVHLMHALYAVRYLRMHGSAVSVLEGSSLAAAAAV